MVPSASALPTFGVALMYTDLADPSNPVVVAAPTHRCECGAGPGVTCESITRKPFPDRRLIHYARVQQWDLPERQMT